MTGDTNVVLRLTQEWKEAREATDEARQRLIPAVQALRDDGMSLRDIAELMDVALGTVQKLLS